MFTGAGPHPSKRPGEPETSGEGEEPEIRSPTRVQPVPMLVVPGMLLLGCLLVGVLPSVGRSLAEAVQLFTDQAGYADAALELAHLLGSPVAPSADWTGTGVLLGLLSTALACGLAVVAVWLPGRRATNVLAQHIVRPLRQLHSGLIGDYIAWLAVGIAVLMIAVAAQS